MPAPIRISTPPSQAWPDWGRVELVISSNSFFFSRSAQLATLATRHAMPTIFGFREFVAAGGLMSYGGSLTESFRWVGVYTGRVLTWISHTIFAQLSSSAGVFIGSSLRVRDPGVARRGRKRVCSGAAGSSEERSLGGPRGGAAVVTRCGDACQPGEARAPTAVLRRAAARPQMAAVGQPEAIANLIRRTLICTSAPILSSWRRMVPHVAVANLV